MRSLLIGVGSFCSFAGVAPAQLEGISHFVLWHVGVHRCGAFPSVTFPDVRSWRASNHFVARTARDFFPIASLLGAGGDACDVVFCAISFSALLFFLFCKLISNCHGGSSPFKCAFVCAVFVCS